VLENGNKMFNSLNFKTRNKISTHEEYFWSSWKCKFTPFLIDIILKNIAGETTGITSSNTGTGGGKVISS